MNQANLYMVLLVLARHDNRPMRGSEIGTFVWTLFMENRLRKPLVSADPQWFPPSGLAAGHGRQLGKSITVGVKWLEELKNYRFEIDTALDVRKIGCRPNEWGYTVNAQRRIRQWGRRNAFKAMEGGFLRGMTFESRAMRIPVSVTADGRQAGAQDVTVSTCVVPYGSYDMTDWGRDSFRYASQHYRLFADLHGKFYLQERRDEDEPRHLVRSAAGGDQAAAPGDGGADRLVPL